MSASVSQNVTNQNLKNVLELIRDEFPETDITALRDALIDTSQFKDRVPLEIVSQNIKSISSILNEPMLGIKVIDRIDLSLIPFVQAIRDHASRSEDFAGKMIIFLSEYFSTITEVVDIQLTWAKDTLHMDISPCEEYVTDIQIEGAMYGIVKILSTLSRINPQSVHLAHKCKTSPLFYTSYFRVEPRFGSEGNTLIYQAKQGYFESLSDKTIKTVSGLNALLKKEFPESGIAKQTKTILKSTIHFGEPSRERVAAILNMSVSTLKRRLLDQGIVFKDLLLELRKEMAVDMLVNQNIKASQVGFMLGYSSQTQFYRAFKGWYGMPVGEFKKSFSDSPSLDQ